MFLLGQFDIAVILAEPPVGVQGVRYLMQDAALVRATASRALLRYTCGVGQLPRVLCRICKRLFTEPGASLAWHANARGRATCPHCRN